MPASQLKRLKASLREQGITGQQKPKKSKKRNAAPSGDQRARRDVTLAQIRESFNPFEVKAPTRPRKFDITTNKASSGKGGNGVLGRPGVTKSYGEETRRRTLLPELHRRNKVGGILDRRIGENDATLTPDERAELRFAKANQRGKSNMFNLEDDEGATLTHLGRSLMDEGDDFQEQVSDASSDLEDEGLGLKRKRPTAEDTDGPAEDGDDLDQPDRKKSKAEVMKEVIAKSKLHKYERQQAKEDDDDLREELDKGMGDLMVALQGHKAPKPVPAPAPAVDVQASMNPDRLALLNGADRGAMDKEYDSRIRQMTLDKRAQPTDRSKTEEEKTKELAERLREQEENRLKRMRGEPVDEDEDKAEEVDNYTYEGDEDVEHDDATAFGLSATQDKRPMLDVEDEDDFVIDNDLVDTDSEHDADDFSAGEEEHASDSESGEDENASQGDDDELVAGLLTREERAALREQQSQRHITGANGEEIGSLSYTYACPRNHEELLEVLSDVPITDLPVAIQRIRAYYDPKAAAENKAKMSDFAASLVSHVVHLGDAKRPGTPLEVIETVIRHVHSLSRTFADSISRAFRQELQALADTNEITPGRLCLLTALGTVFPTSDHFHQVVTPAITLIARWLSLTTPKSPQDFANGAYLGALCIRYQHLSKRYIPELLRFIATALRSPQCPEDFLAAHIANLSAAMDLWSSKSALTEMLSPTIFTALKSCQHPSATLAFKKLKILLQQSRHARRPLELHHWRPLPIKTAIPAFEDNFNPDKHYDPDFQRSESNKLRGEYKRERKGALRELRKDANFVARERLREKRERDAAHEAKERRIIAEINAEGGQERNEYERDRKRRKQKGGR